MSRTSTYSLMARERLEARGTQNLFRFGRSNLNGVLGPRLLPREQSYAMSHFPGFDAHFPEIPCGARSGEQMDPGTGNPARPRPTVALHCPRGPMVAVLAVPASAAALTHPHQGTMNSMAPPLLAGGAWLCFPGIQCHGMARHAVAKPHAQLPSSCHATI